VSVDETDDSLIRAIAASPARPAPARRVSVILVDASVAALRAVADSFGAKLSVRSDGIVQLVIVDDEGATKAAACALALRAAASRSRLVIATGPAEAAASAHAVVLLKDTERGAIALDDATAELLDASFEIEGDSPKRFLRGKRTVTATDHAATGSAADAISAEGWRGDLGVRLGRLVGVTLWITANAIQYAIQPSAARKVTFFVGLAYGAGAILCVVLIDVLRLRFLAEWSGYFLDVPVAGALAIAVSRVAPSEAGWVCGTASTLCCMFIAVNCAGLRQRQVIGTTISSVVVMTIVYRVVKKSGIAYPLHTLPFVLTCILCLRLMRRVPALLHRVVDEANARAREAEVLNAELRRQIADRAEQLATALARLQTPSPSRALHAGMVLEDRYRVVRPIGRGGMGAVYEVERVADERRLALKVLTGATDQVSLARFAREAHVAAALNHANVVSVLDVDVSRSGLLFVVMELVTGGSLVAERGRYGDATWALPILRQIAAALTAMHARGNVHLDLKPSNILLDGDTVKVADFGLVGILHQTTPADTRAPAPAALDAASPTLTRTGAIMGTPMYMAPELARGAREAAPSSDVFSFGVLAYELLANTLPFAAPPVLERVDGRATPSATRLAHTRPDLAREVSALVDDCLAERPETRPTADALVAALENVAR
jgi:hypothetical protein